MSNRILNESTPLYVYLRQALDTYYHEHPRTEPLVSVIACITLAVIVAESLPLSPHAFLRICRQLFDESLQHSPKN